MSASYSTHVMRYCAKGCELAPFKLRMDRCRGHRVPRPPAPDYGQAAPFAKPQRKPEPMEALVRVRNYVDQNYLEGRNGDRLTVRQERQIRRMANRARRRAAA